METGVSSKIVASHGPLFSVGRKHIAEGAGCESNPSWLPIYKTRLLSKSLRESEKLFWEISGLTACPLVWMD